jgi:hypothetical protein
MTYLGLSTLLGKALTDEKTLDQLCGRLKTRNKNEIKALEEWAGVELDKKEVDYLFKERDVDICQCLRILSKCLEIEYNKSGGRPSEKRN